MGAAFSAAASSAAAMAIACSGVRPREKKSRQVASAPACTSAATTPRSSAAAALHSRLVILRSGRHGTSHDTSHLGAMHVGRTPLMVSAPGMGSQRCIALQGMQGKALHMTRCSRLSCGVVQPGGCCLVHLSHEAVSALLT